MNQPTNQQANNEHNTFIQIRYVRNVERKLRTAHSDIAKLVSAIWTFTFIKDWGMVVSENGDETWSDCGNDDGEGTNTDVQTAAYNVGDAVEDDDE